VHISTLIFVVAADLGRNKHTGEVFLGRETARVCNKAATQSVYRKEDEPLVVVTAGYSPKFRVNMGDLMVQQLKNSAVKDITSSMAGKFNTDGEIQALICETLRAPTNEKVLKRLYVVARWWHMPRIAFLLWYRLEEEDEPIEIRYIPVGSRDVLGMLREPFAFAVNVFRLAFEKEPSALTETVDAS
jgi:hypothetical protein